MTHTRSIVSKAKTLAAAALLALGTVACSEDESYSSIVDELLASADSVFRSSNPLDAIDLQRQAASAAFTDIERLESNIELAQSYYFVGDLDSTVAIITESLQYFDTLSTVTPTTLRMQMTVLELYADILRSEMLTDESLEYYRRSANIAHLLKLDEDYVKNMLYVYKSDEERGNYSEAIDGYNELYTICTRSDLDGLRANVINSLLSVYLTIFDHEQASELLYEMRKDVDESDPLIAAMLAIDEFKIALVANNNELQQRNYNNLQRLISDDLVKEYYAYDIYKQMAEYHIRHHKIDSARVDISHLIAENKKYTTPQQNEYLKILTAHYHIIAGNQYVAKQTLDGVDVKLIKTDYIDLYIHYLYLRSQVLYNFGQYSEAYDLLRQQSSIVDGLKKENIAHNLAYKTMIFRRDTTIIGQRFQLIQQQEELKSTSIWQRTWIMFFVVVLLLSALIFMYFRISSIRKHEESLLQYNERLQLEVNRQTSILKSQENELKEKQSNMATQVFYAGQIQRSLLPPIKEIHSPFIADKFIIYKPCSTMSGDFYWCGHRHGKLIIVCGDATGHGIPGALVAMVCTTILNSLNDEDNIHSLTDLLNVINRQLYDILHRNNATHADDSIDMSILVIDQQTGKMNLALARHNAYIVRAHDKSIHRMQGVRRSIGEDCSDKACPFEIIDLKVERGDMIYMLSDGYESQLGGPEGKKFKRQAMTELFVSIADKPTSEQQEILNTTNTQWRGSEEQTDDILIIGIKFSAGNTSGTA